MYTYKELKSIAHHYL